MSGPKRLLFLIGQLGMGGSERQLFLLLRSMDRSRVVPTVVVFNPSPNRTYQSALEESGIEVFQVPPSRRSKIHRLVWLIRLMRRLRPHIVHSWTVHDNPFAGIAGFVAGVPHRFGSLRGSMTLEGFQSLPRLYRKLSLSSVSHLVVNSRAIAEELIEAGHDSTRVVVLPNCVSLSENTQGPLDLTDVGIGSGDLVVGTVGNLRPVKNHALFVRAMARCLEGRPEVKAVIAGHPLDSCPGIEENLRREIGRLGLYDRILLTGFCADVPGLMKRMDVFCLTSDSEGLPNVILEAMAAGLPVVATAVGGVPEVVDDDGTGYLVKAGDAEALADRVARLLDDGDLRRRLGSKGRQRIEGEHGCSAQAARLADFYELVVHGKENNAVEETRS